MTSLPIPLRTKLQPLLLMLSSEYPGEQQAAAAAIGRVLKAHKCSWHDLSAVLTEAPPAPPPPPPPPVREPRVRKRSDGEGYEIPAVDLVALLDVIRGGGQLDSYNAEFVDGMEDRAAKWRVVRLSERQFAHLTRLLESA